MAVLSDAVLQKLRQAIARGSVKITVDNKAQANAIFQALEDYFEATTRGGFSSAINGVKPGLAVDLKTEIVKVYLQYKWTVE